MREQEQTPQARRIDIYSVGQKHSTGEMIQMAKKNITHMDLNRNDYANTSNEELIQIWLYQSGLHDLPNKQLLASWEINHRITKTEHMSSEVDSELFHLRFGGQDSYEEQRLITQILNRMN